MAMYEATLPLDLEELARGIIPDSSWSATRLLEPCAGAAGELDKGEKTSTLGLWYLVGMAIRLSSPAFEGGGAIPRKYTGEGEGVSPPLEWTGLPEGTREVALICDDPDAPTAEPFVHWVLYKIPANKSVLPEGSAAGALEGRNSFGKIGYGGLMPPEGHGTHHYHFRVYALGTHLDATPGLSKDQLLAAMEGHILEEGELVGTYER